MDEDDDIIITLNKEEIEKLNLNEGLNTKLAILRKKLKLLKDINMKDDDKFIIENENEEEEEVKDEKKEIKDILKDDQIKIKKFYVIIENINYQNDDELKIFCCKKDTLFKIKKEIKKKFNDNFQFLNEEKIINPEDEKKIKVENIIFIENDERYIKVKIMNQYSVFDKTKNMIISKIQCSPNDKLEEIRKIIEKKKDIFNFYFCDKNNNKFSKESEVDFKVNEILDENKIIINCDDNVKDEIIKKNLNEIKEDKKEEQDFNKNNIILNNNNQNNNTILEKENINIKNNNEIINEKQEKNIKNNDKDSNKNILNNDIKNDKIVLEEKKENINEKNENKINNKFENNEKEEKNFDLNEENKKKEKELEEIINKIKENGVCFEYENEKNLKYFHIQIETNKKYEIFSDESKKTFDFINFDKNKFFVILPIFKDFQPDHFIKFKIRDKATKKPINIEIENLTYSDNFYKISLPYKQNESLFNIINEPKFNEQNLKLLFLQKLFEINYYICDDILVKNFLNSLNYEIILDKIIEIGFKHKLFMKLIENLVIKNISLEKISLYLENNKNKYNEEDFKKNAPKIIYNVHEFEKPENKNNNVQNNNLDNYILCCNKNILQNIENEQESINKEKIKENLLNYKLNESKIELEKITEYKKIIEEKIKKYNLNIECIFTKETLQKLYKLELGIKSNIPMLIQGFTSAGKSYLSKIALKLNQRDYYSFVLSEETTQEDLLGRDNINKNSIQFYSGILLKAYEEGKTVILDECDLAQPKILSCIIGTITKDELIVNNKVFYKNSKYNIILTMNGESKGFKEEFRNILSTNILSKFMILHFNEIDLKESEEIFTKQLENCVSYKNYIDNFKDIHIFMNKNKKSKENKNSDEIDSFVTLRNLKNLVYYDKSNLHPKIAAKLSYFARFPKNEYEKKTELKKYLEYFNNFKELDNEIEKNKNELEKLNIKLIYNNNYLNVIYLALKSCESGCHPLLIGKNGSGLTTLAKVIALLFNKNIEKNDDETKNNENNNKNNENNNNKYEYLLCHNETSTEDLFGQYFLSTKQNNNNNNERDLSSLVEWNDGVVIKGIKEGKPVILDDLNNSKAQTIESLNSILETNVKFQELNYPNVQKDNEIIKNDKNKKFIIIGTMKIGKKEKQISPALMNRFNAIYLDEIEISKENIENLVEKTVENLKNEIKINKDKNNKNIHLIKQINEEDKINFKNFILKHLDGFLLIKEKEKNIKMIVKQIKKNFLIYKKLKNINEHLSFEFCYNLNNSQFNKIKDNEIKNLLQNILNDLNKSQIDSSFFFYEENSPEKNNVNDAFKMILTLITNDLTNSNVFFQGVPSSGKSCAAKFYGSKRQFNNRDPILSINCNKDMQFDSLVGTFSFKNEEFKFNKGPLIIAMENGEPILLDEFNLCSDNVLYNLLPVLKANIGEKIYLKNVPEEIYIKPGFMIIATGNFNSERGRKKIDSLILNEMNVLKLEKKEFNKNIIDKILENNYKEIKTDENNIKDKNKFKISVEQIKGIFDVIKKYLNINLSIRQIKILLERIKRFKDKIEVIYIVLCYILPLINKEDTNIDKIIEELDKIFEYKNLKELNNFIKSEVIIFKEKKVENFIKKGNIKLSTSIDDKKKLPQILKEILFYIRMSCSYENDDPSEENLALIGPSGFKNYILNVWLENNDKYKNKYYKKNETLENFKENFSLTKNTEIQDLIGTSSLDDDDKITEQIEFLKDALDIYFNVKNIDEEEKNIEEKIKEKNKNENNECIFYIINCIHKLEKLKTEKNEKKNSLLKIKTITSFNLGIIPKNFIFGKILILKGAENPNPAVLERLNSILEFPRNLVLSEDNQNIFNDKKIFEKIFLHSRNSLPMNKNFRIFFTSKDSFTQNLSEAFRSRITIINCPDYSINNYLTMEIKNQENEVLNEILENEIKDSELKENIKKLMNDFENKNILNYIRCFKSIKNIYQNIETISNKIKDSISEYEMNQIIKNKYKFPIGIGFLRCIFDKLNSNERKKQVERIKNYLPPKLYELITNNNNELILENPFEELKINNQIFIKSKYSEIMFEIEEYENENNKDKSEENKRENKLNKIIWTKSTIDLVDALFTSIISKSILILEGPPGIGKTAISIKIFEYLNIKYNRINFSPSTTKDDVFMRIIPKIDKNQNKISTKNEKRELLTILLKDEKHKNKGLILDEMNLASSLLLENLYIYLKSIINNESEFNYSGNNVKIFGNIFTVITMNNASVSNSRISLENSFLNQMHLFKLSNCDENEIKQLIEGILLEKSNIKNENQEIEKLIKKINEINENKKGDKKISVREILNIKNAYDKLDIEIDDEIIDLFSNVENESKVDKNEKKLKNYEKENFTFCNEYLYFCGLKYKLNNQPYFNNQIQFTFAQKEAIYKILIGLIIEKSILLNGEIGSGKTFIIEKLAEMTGNSLKIIQFTNDTNSNDLIGRLELNKYNFDDELKEKLNEIKEILIKIQYEKITKFILILNEMEPNKILNFIKNLNEEIINEENKKKLIEIIDNKKIIEDLEKLTGLNMNFEFNKSVLLEAMEKGNWILLDDINLKPEEIERLMSLLEEDSKLSIYEDYQKNSENNNVLTYKKDNINKSKNEKKIHSNFRLFISTSNDKLISPAIKSRCINVNLENFQNPKDYSILLSNNLLNSGFDDENIKIISKCMANGFFNIKNNNIEKRTNYILSNYILTSSNLIIFAKLLIDNINELNKITQFIILSIFSSFVPEKCEEFIKIFGNNFIDDNINLNLIFNIKKAHEFYLSQCEILIISYYKQTSGKDINEIKAEIESIEFEENKKKIKKKFNLNEKRLKNVEKNEIKKFVEEKYLIFISNLTKFTLKNIIDYYFQINEVFIIINNFFKNDLIFNQFYFFKYLNFLIKTKINDTIKNDKEYYNKKIEDIVNEIKNEKKKENLFYFINIINFYEILIPNEINLFEMKKCLIKLYLDYYKNKKIEENNDNYLFYLLNNKKIKKIIKNNFDIIFENKIYEKNFEILLKIKDEFDIIKNDDKIIIKNENLNSQLEKKLNEIIDEEKLLKDGFLEEKKNNKKILIKTTFDLLFKNDLIIFKFPKIFYNNDNIYKIFWFFSIFLPNNIDETTIENIISPEIFYYSKEIENILKKYNSIKKISLIGDLNFLIEHYKYFEGIKKINENNISFNKGINLFIEDDKIRNIKKANDIFNKINKIFNDYNVNIKKNWKKTEIQKKIDKLKEEYDKINIKKKKDFYKEEIKKLYNEFKKYEFRFNKTYKEIQRLERKLENDYFSEENFRKLKDEIDAIIKNDRKNNYKNKNKNNSSFFEQNNEKSTFFTQIIYKFYKLNLKIKEVKNCNFEDYKNLLYDFINIYDSWPENIEENLYINNIDEFKEKNIDNFKKYANYFLIDQIISHKKENYNDDFEEFFIDLLNIKDLLKNLSTIFKDNDSICFPILKMEDIIFYIHEKLTIKKFLKDNEMYNIFYNKLKKCEKIEDCLVILNNLNKSEDEYDKDLYDKYIKELKPLENNLIEFYNIKIKKIYDELNKFKNNKNLEWQILSLEELKEKNCWEKPSQLIIKNKYNINFKDKNEILREEDNIYFLKIKSLYAIFKSINEEEINLIDLETLSKEKIKEIINNDFNNYKYKFRIMELFDFNYDFYRDNYSETMFIIIKTLDEKLKIINFEEDELKLINKIYKEIIIKTLNEEKPDLTQTNVVNVIKIFLNFLIQKFNLIYDKL